MTRVEADHIDEIEKSLLATHGASSLYRDDVVRASWRRCVEQHRLQPGKAYEVPVLPQASLRERQDAADELLRASQSAIEHLYRFVSRQGYIVAFLDANGVIIDYRGDRIIETDVKQARLYLGAMWSEKFAGTCAGGSCIETGDVLTVHQRDHFDVRLAPVTCTAAPIYDARGGLSAVLNVSALHSPSLKSSQDFVHRMVASTARRIELASLLSKNRSDWVLCLSNEPEVDNHSPEGAIALDGAGRIIGVTQAARKFLAKGLDADWNEVGGVLGRKLSDFLEFDIDALPSFDSKALPEHRIIKGHSGNATFAHAVAPRNGMPRFRGATVDAFDSLSRDDPAMNRLLATARKLAPTKLPIFVQGETGSGKERLARAIHEVGRPGARFVPVNCAALPEALIEGELFGHAPGAFTGATSKGRKGLIEEADGGTLFLDEIGDMPLPLQARMLRVLSEGEVLPLGSRKLVKVDVRVVSATHQNLATLVERGLFREDLYHRIVAVTLNLPPLRERVDFDWLVDGLIRETDQPQVLLSPAVRNCLRQRRWPGNIRELKNVLNLAIAVADGPAVEICDLPETIAPVRSPSAVPARIEATKAGNLTEEAIEFNSLLDLHSWNISDLARSLGVDRSTVHRRIKRLGLVSPNHRAG